MRAILNIVVHEYFQMQLDIPWRTAQEHLPPLVPKLQAMLVSANPRSLVWSKLD